jgi:hypothetical protein
VPLQRTAGSSRAFGALRNDKILGIAEGTHSVGCHNRDFVVDWGQGFWRVQVKGGTYCERSKYQAGAGGKGRPFTREDMDFVVVHIVPLGRLVRDPDRDGGGVGQAVVQSEVYAGSV